MTLPQNSPSDFNESIQPENSISPEESAPQPRQVQVQIKTKRPIVVYSIMGVTIFVWLLQLASNFLLGGDLPAALMEKSNQLIQQGQLWRLITPVLLHSSSFSSILHIVFNMYALNVIGPMLEQFYGHRRFLALYLVTGICGNLFSFIFSQYDSLGASTAIFGLIAAQLIFVFNNRLLFGQRYASILKNTGVVILINLSLGFVPGIDMWGHVGGLLGGLAFAWVAGPRMEVKQQGTELQLINTRTSVRFWGSFAFETALLFFIATLVIFFRR
jgi:rhomboid protease GluP